MTTLEKIIREIKEAPNDLGLLFSKSQIVMKLERFIDDEQKQLDEMYNKGFEAGSDPGARFKSIKL
jgi:hypothetical protein